MPPPRSDAIPGFARYSIFAIFSLILSVLVTAVDAQLAAEDSLSPLSDENGILASQVLTHLEPDGGNIIYEPHFVGQDRGIIGRADPNPSPLPNNIPFTYNIPPSTTQYYKFQQPTTVTANVIRRSQENVLEERAASEIDTSNHDEQLDAVRRNDSWTKRQAGPAQTVYVTINTCLQPISLVDISKPANMSGVQNNQWSVPQLTLLILNSPSGVLDPTSITESVQLTEGYAMLAINSASDFYVGVASPVVPLAQGETWNYQVAASVDAPFHSFNGNVTLELIDSDAEAALLVTSGLNLTASDPKDTRVVADYLKNGPPLSIFVSSVNNTKVNGIRHSYCGLSEANLISNTESGSNIDLGLDYNQYLPDSIAEERFYVPNLVRSSSYSAFLAQKGNFTAGKSGAEVIGGGGAVYASQTFTTKRDLNCALIYDLDFCSTVEYAVPANSDTFPTLAGLRDLYDNSARALYQNFNYSLQQIPCNTTSSAQYSLAVTCDDCAAAYRRWLCAVTIPRCEDFSLPNDQTLSNATTDDNGCGQDYKPYLMPRNVAQSPIQGSRIQPCLLQNQTQQLWLATNSSRNNATIAGEVQPGPYREVLPCQDLCFDLVRTCPAALQFSCPDPGSFLLSASYGQRGNAGNDGAVMCNAPGVVYGRNSAAAMTVHWYLFAAPIMAMYLAIS